MLPGFRKSSEDLIPTAASRFGIFADLGTILYVVGCKIACCMWGDASRSGLKQTTY